jgi:hypothetical protein
LIKTFLKRILFVSIALLISALSLEGYLQFLWSQKTVVTKEWNATRKYNQLGFRDKEYSREKPEGIFRIVILGDSFTYGHSIDNIENVYHKLLEKSLNKGLPDKKFEVMSLTAHNGGNTDGQLYLLYKKGFSLNPDLVILGFYQNDMPTLYDNKHTGESDYLNPLGGISTNSPFAKFKLYQGLYFQTKNLKQFFGLEKTGAELLNYLYNSRSWDIEKIFIDTIYGSLAVKNIHFLLTIFPAVYQLEKSHPFIYSEKFAQYCKSRPFLCVDYFQEAFNGMKTDSLIVNPYDRHLNEKGHEIVAETLFNKLRYLKDYKNLSHFHKGVTLRELVEQKSFLQKIDQEVLKIKPNESRKFSNDNQIVFLSKLAEGTKLKKIKVDSQTQQTLFSREIHWNNSGDIQKRETKFFRKEGNPLYFITTKKDKKNWIENTWDYSLNALPRTRNPQKYQKTFVLKLLTTGKGKGFLKITHEDNFRDPKATDRYIFSESLKVRGPTAEQAIYETLNFYQNGIFNFISWPEYAKALSQTASNKNTSIATLRAIKRFQATKSKHVSKNIVNFQSGTFN